MLQKKMRNSFCITFIFLVFGFAKAGNTEWLKKETGQYNLHYTIIDKNVVSELEGYVTAGFKSISKFFNKPFKTKIDIYIFPDRSSLDKEWQIVFKDTGFRSQCWMVASGVGTRLDIVSPSIWAKENCEHDGNNKKEVQEIITHELTHVFHGQYNSKSDFEGMDNLGWLGKLPVKLENIWSGKAKYGLAGSLVKYIDVTYGRKTVIELLAITDQAEALISLKLSEGELLTNWENYISKN